jgi:hypothetical protein
VPSNQRQGVIFDTDFDIDFSPLVVCTTRSNSPGAAQTPVHGPVGPARRFGMQSCLAVF